MARKLLEQFKSNFKKFLELKNRNLILVGLACAIALILFIVIGSINENTRVEVERSNREASQLATQLGFASISEMQELQAKGFNKKTDYEDDQAKKEGFESLSQKREINAKGFFSQQEYVDANEAAKKAGWESLEEKKEANSRGIEKPKEFHAQLAEEARKLQILQKELDRVRAQEERKKDNEVYCYMYKQALDACATAFDTNKCLGIKLPNGDVYKYQSACY